MDGCLVHLQWKIAGNRRVGWGGGGGAETLVQILLANCSQNMYFGNSVCLCMCGCLHIAHHVSACQCSAIATGEFALQ